MIGILDRLGCLGLATYAHTYMYNDIIPMVFSFSFYRTCFNGLGYRRGDRFARPFCCSCHGAVICVQKAKTMLQRYEDLDYIHIAYINLF